MCFGYTFIGPKVAEKIFVQRQTSQKHPWIYLGFATVPSSPFASHLPTSFVKRFFLEACRQVTTFCQGVKHRKMLQNLSLKQPLESIVKSKVESIAKSIETMKMCINCCHSQILLKNSIAIDFNQMKNLWFLLIRINSRCPGKKLPKKQRRGFAANKVYNYIQ